jgi:hypothetical protein
LGRARGGSNINHADGGCARCWLCAWQAAAIGQSSVAYTFANIAQSVGGVTATKTFDASPKIMPFMGISGFQ